MGAMPSYAMRLGALTIVKAAVELSADNETMRTETAELGERRIRIAT
jgi:hypothetical protein